MSSQKYDFEVVGNNFGVNKPRVLSGEKCSTCDKNKKNMEARNEELKKTRHELQLLKNKLILYESGQKETQKSKMDDLKVLLNFNDLQASLHSLKRNQEVLKEDAINFVQRQNASFSTGSQQVCLQLSEISRNYNSLFLEMSIKSQRAEELQQQIDLSEHKINSLRQECEDLRIEYESRIRNLKQQIALAFRDNSRERQVQIDELTKQLRNLHAEASNIRRNVGVLPQECFQCVLLKAQVAAKDKLLEEKDVMISCVRSEVQKR